MTKLSKRGLASVLLLIFASLIGFSTPSGFSLGDKLFELLGLPVWSSGQSGSHYPGIFALCLLVMAAVWVGTELGGRRLLVVLIVVLPLTPGAASLSETIYYKAHSGIWAIDYDPGGSRIVYSSAPDNRALAVSGQLALTNYGGRPVTFGIRVLDDTAPPDGLFPKGIVLSDADNAGDAGQFTLQPGEKQNINVRTEVPLAAAGIHDVSGEFSGPDLVLSAADGAKIVGRNR